MKMKRTATASEVCWSMGSMCISFSLQQATVTLLTLLAAAGTGVSAQGTRVFCRFKSATSTTIASEEGYEDALINIAEAICPSASGGRPPALNASFTVVASTIATAVAEVVGQCAGEGTARLTVQGRSRADISTRAEAVGNASQDIVITSGVCRQCEEALLAFADAIKAMPVTAVAEATLNESLEFTGEPFTVRQVERVVESQVIVLLVAITEDARAAAAGGACIADAASGPPPVLQFRDDCSAAVSADDLLVDTEPITDAGIALGELGCDGSQNAAAFGLAAADFAAAYSDAITSVLTACDSGGGAATVPCTVSMGTIDSVASQQIAAVFEGLDLAEYLSPECECDLVQFTSEENLQIFFANSTVQALASVCTDGAAFTSTSDFEAALQDSISVAVTGLVLSGASSEACGGTAAAAAAAPSPAGNDKWRSCDDGMKATASCSETGSAAANVPASVSAPGGRRAATTANGNGTAPAKSPAPAPDSVVAGSDAAGSATTATGPDGGNRTAPEPAPLPAPSPTEAPAPESAPAPAPLPRAPRARGS